MKAMILHKPGQPLSLEQVPTPRPGPGQALLRVLACGVCHTDLHILDGELAHPKLPLILGHQIVGEVVELGSAASGDGSSSDELRGNEPSSDEPPGNDAPGSAAAGDQPHPFHVGQRVGVPWLGWTDGSCRFCRRGQENLCPQARFTGYHIDGGFAEYAVADTRYCFALPHDADPLRLAPLLCAGLIGYRAYRLAGPQAERLGIYGFGAAAHLVTQVARRQGREVYAFTRPGDHAAQAFALRMGAAWAGSSLERPPVELDAALIFAPVGALVPAALEATAPGGAVVCGGIHMSDIPAFPYSLLWQERVLRSVANLTRQDGEEFLALAAQEPLEVEVHAFPLPETNQALAALRQGSFTGAAVISV